MGRPDCWVWAIKAGASLIEEKNLSFWFGIFQFNYFAHRLSLIKGSHCHKMEEKTPYLDSLGIFPTSILWPELENKNLLFEVETREIGKINKSITWNWLPWKQWVNASENCSEKSSWRTGSSKTWETGQLCFHWNSPPRLGLKKISHTFFYLPFLTPSQERGLPPWIFFWCKGEAWRKVESWGPTGKERMVNPLSRQLPFLPSLLPTFLHLCLFPTTKPAQFCLRDEERWGGEPLPRRKQKARRPCWNVGEQRKGAGRPRKAWGTQLPLCRTYLVRTFFRSNS